MKKHTVIAFLLVAAMSFFLYADGLRICPSCGREDEVGVEKCPACGAALPPLEKAAEPLPEVPAAPQSGYQAVSNAFDEAARDVKEAGKCREESPAKALAIYENALALLSSESGAAFKESAAKVIVKEIEATKTLVKTQNPSLTKHRLALQQGVKDAVLYFKGAGRIQCGRAWIPTIWSEELTPAQIASVRHALPPSCKSCAGLGFDLCAKCNGRGRQPCKNPGCKQGWIYQQSANDLSPKTALKTREKCPECQGSSFQNCLGCNGNGTVICKKCNGTGEASLCTSCQGTGLIECKSCKKSPAGAVCPECKGTQEALCKKCGGDGRIIR